MMGSRWGQQEVVIVRALRVRFVARWVGATLVVVALVVQSARFVSRPYPTGGWLSSAAYYVPWSDDTITVVNDGPRDLDMRVFGPVTLVRWPDGRYSMYLHLRRDTLSGRFW